MVVTGLEVIPISTLLTLVTSQVLAIAVAAKDVLVEKESFQKLSRFLYDIEPVLKELNERCFKDLTAANQALNALKTDLNRAHELVDGSKDKSKFYLLLNCRAIVKEAQTVTRDIGKDLELLSLAGTELSLDVRDNLTKLKNQFLSAEYQASETRLDIINKLEMGIREHRTDQGFANDLVVMIARAVGVPVDPSEISKELSSFKREKEYLAERKARQEEAFMEQVIQLLSKADASYTSDILRQNYMETVNNMNGEYEDDEPIEPLGSFICPLKHEVMVDPVTTSSNIAYERVEIERWFASGKTVDPFTHVELADFSLRPNNSLKKTIQEWTEQNYCIRIRRAKKLLETKDPGKAQAALDDLQRLCQESNINTEWIAAAGVIPAIVGVLKLRDKPVMGKALETIRVLVRNYNTRNRDEVVQVGGVELVVRCLSKSVLSKPAASLLLELLQGDERPVCEKLCKDKAAFLYLVFMLQSDNADAKLILEKLSDRDENIVQMASMCYFDPLISSILEGSAQSKLVMAREIGNMESLSDENKHMLGERGVIPPLLHMMISGNLEAKHAALQAISNLSSNSHNQQLIANAGGFSILMNHLTSPRSPESCRQYAAIALKNLTQGSRDLTLTMDMKVAVMNLFGLLRTSYGATIRSHILQVLLGLARSDAEEKVQQLIQESEGVEFLVGLLEGTEKDVRDSAIYLIQTMSSQGGSAQISQVLVRENKLDFLVNLLSSSADGNIRSSVSSVLGSLPDNKEVMKTLLDAGVIPVLLSQIKEDNSKLVEASLGALQRFTKPFNMDLQRNLAESGIHTLLVTVLNSGTLTAKAEAAKVLSNMSTNTTQLSAPPTATGWMCFRTTAPSLCKVHRGVCNPKTTFCIVEARAVPGLVSLLDEPASLAAEASVVALFTLVSDSETIDRGVWFLHEANAINKILQLLSQGTEVAKECTVDLLTRIFQVKKMRDMYGLKAKLPLVELASHGSVTCKRKAARVLARLSLIQEISSYF